MTSYSGSWVRALVFFKGANTQVFVLASPDVDGVDVKFKSAASNEHLNPTCRDENGKLSSGPKFSFV